MRQPRCDVILTHLAGPSCGYAIWAGLVGGAGLVLLPGDTS